MERRLTRRGFVVKAAAGSLGLMAGAGMTGCGARLARGARTDDEAPGEAPREDEPGEEAGPLVEGSARAFPCVEVAGSPREIGRGIGRMFGDHVRTGLERRRDWFAPLRSFAAGEGRAALDAFEAAARKHTPRAYEELVGWSMGSGVPYEDLLALNLQAELRALIDQRARASAGPEEENPGCSTIVQAAGGAFVHVHNEDGDAAYSDLMFLVKASPTRGVPYLALCYPGVLPGNAPAVNAAGIAQTTNFIPCREARPRVGRYFLDRECLEARSIEEALRWSTHPERAFGFHHVFSSLAEGRAVAVEVSASRQKVVEIDGLYYHTNHLVMEGMEDEAQDERYVSSSSSTRWNVLGAWAKGLGEPGTMGADELVAPLSSHQGSPYSPCRHPQGEITGATLATAVFRSGRPVMRLSKGQPCLGRWSEFPVPRGSEIGYSR
jgi:isopenicillin-N N-acyltransferase-like protein